MQGHNYYWYDHMMRLHESLIGLWLSIIFFFFSPLKGNRASFIAVDLRDYKKLYEVM